MIKTKPTPKDITGRHVVLETNKIPQVVALEPLYMLAAIKWKKNLEKNLKLLVFSEPVTYVYHTTTLNLYNHDSVSPLSSLTNQEKNMALGLP